MFRRSSRRNVFTGIGAMEETFFDYLVRVGVLNRSQLDMLTAERRKLDATLGWGAVRQGWITPKDIQRVWEQLTAAPEQSFVSAARQLELLTTEQEAELTHWAAECGEQFCAEAVQRGWITEGQLRILRRHFHRMQTARPVHSMGTDHGAYLEHTADQTQGCVGLMG